MNISLIKTPPDGLAAHLRQLADAVDAGEVVSYVAAWTEQNEYRFEYAASLSTCLTLATLLQRKTVDRMFANGTERDL